MLTWFRRFLEGIGLMRRSAPGADWDPDLKYVNVRRYLAYLEHSIEEKTQWGQCSNRTMKRSGQQCVAKLKFFFIRNGHLAAPCVGPNLEEAYFVKCDRSTMTQDDLDNGRLVALVGVAPLRPAAFVIFRIGQWTAAKKEP